MGLRTPSLRPALIEEPIRAELFGIERLEEHARSLAAAQRVRDGGRLELGRGLVPRAEDNGRVLREAHRIIAETIRAERWITPAAEWLVDNFFIVDEQLREIRDDLPSSFYRELPKLADGHLAGYPRVYGIAWAFVAHTDSRVDPETLRRFVQAYQRVQPLTIGELWALTIALRLVLVENLRRLAEAMVRRRQARREADLAADELLGSSGAATRLSSLAWPRDPSLERVFTVELVQRLRDQDAAVMPALAALRERLASQGTNPDELALVEHQQQASTTVTVRNVITSMRLVSALDWTAFFESVSLVDEALRAGSAFARMDFVSRDEYRHAIERLARGSRRSELDVAQAALAEAARARAGPSATDVERRGDPGFSLIGGGRRSFERALGFRPGLPLRMQRLVVDHPTTAYLGTLLLWFSVIVALPLTVSSHAGVSLAGLIVLASCAAIPASDLALALLNRAVTSLFPPLPLPRLEWTSGVPAECRTMVVVPTLLATADDVEEHVERLELHYLANTEGDLRFAILSDWADAPAESLPDDATILAAARAGVARLNARHGPAPDGGPRFFAYHRRRLWNASEGVWMGWERKRGKLHELNRLLRGATDTTFLDAQDVPAGVRYVVTLDADTRLPIGAIARLVGTIAHPLNRPRLDAASRRVVDGYAVLQPRVTPPLPGPLGSIFQRLSSGSAGIDPYAAAVSDVYQDLFAEGSYTGKGLYDVDAFEAALAGRVPENALLSHDLFEGLFARAGLVTDTEFFEVAPPHYLAAAARQHRWARGDWQLLPWIVGERLSVIARWKLLDNLRRTLSMPAAVATLAAGWLWPASPSSAWTAFVLAVVAIPPLIPVIADAWPRGRGISKRSHLRAVARDLQAAVCQAALSLTLMADQAWRMGDAIVRTLVRLLVTRRRLLEWVPMMHAASRAPSDLPDFSRRMGGGLVIAGAAAVALTSARPAAWADAAPLVGLWLIAPAIARYVSLPGSSAQVEPLSADESRTLRLIARRTWGYFTTFVTRESRSLPPDNFQETPQPVVAERTSPTNVGLYLLSAVAARDFGWAGTHELVERLEATFETLDTLELHRGHLYNWYDTRDGAPLEPRYVSAVDSGNLAGALLTVGNALRELREQPAAGRGALSGIADAAHLLREAVRDPDGGRSATATGGAGENGATGERQRLERALDVVLALVAQETGHPAEWAARLAELESATRTAAACARDAGVPEWGEALRGAVEAHARDLDLLMPWARLRPDPSIETVLAPLRERWPTLAGLPLLCETALAELASRRSVLAESDVASPDALRPLDALAVQLEHATAAATTLIRRLDALAGKARALVDAMDFRFLFDPVRVLFAIGYRVREGSLDPGHYDLLASEARLLSFIAIAKGDVPVKHWFRLGRPLTPVGKDSVLLSWSGSMFEYLMPELVMRSPPGSLLEQTCRLAVRRQIEYAAERGVPWGISESAYSARDLGMTYQYSHFGVPELGLRRGLAENLVIAPYATALAAMVEPREAVAGLRALAGVGAAGTFGFYDALDYTRARLPADVPVAVVRTYMAHHQGMLIVSLGNVLHGGAMPARFHAEPMVRASELLLQERTPRDVPVARPPTGQAAVADVREPVPPQTRHFTTPHGATPRTQILSNGRYAVMITAAGSGSSRWRDLALTRWREDPTLDDTGSYVFLRDVDSGASWSAGFQPSGVEPASYEVHFSEDRAEFLRRDGALGTRLEVLVSSEDDVEVRRVSLTNFGARTREIEVTSCAEIVLAPPAADAAHPAFAKLFVQTEALPERDLLLATRRPRSPEEAPIWLGHVLAVEGETVGNLEWETDRGRFIGRGRTLRTARAVTEEGALSGTVGAVLDPLVSLRRRVRVRPGKTVRLVFSTLVAPSRQAALDLADRCHDVTSFERAAMLAWTQAQVQLHHLGIGPDEAHLFQTLGGALLFADRGARAPEDVLARQSGGLPALWAHSISGDLPVVLVEIDEADDVGLVRQLLRAHEYLRLKRLAFDLVILNDRAPSYVQDLQSLLETLVRTSQSMPRQEGHESRGQVFILRSDRLAAGQRDTLAAAARLALSNRRGTLASQLARAQRPAPTAAPPARQELLARAAPRTLLAELRPEPSPAETPRARPTLEFFNGLGGFSAQGREYVVILRAGQWTPAPWINVIANRDFGCLASESGSGCTWSINSQERLLTPWSNDPVSDPPGEALYVRDEDSGELWTPTALPVREPDGEYVVRHGAGYSRFEREAHGIALELLQFVSADDPVKYSRLVLTNRSSRVRRLSVTAYVEWVLGASRSATAPFVATELDAASGALFARNSWSRDFAARVAFLDLRGAQTAWTGDRGEFLGRNGAAAGPAALRGRRPLSRRVGAGLDPCGALQTTLELRPGARAEVVLLLGDAASREQARELIERHRAADLEAELRRVTEGWDEVLGAVQVRTPDRALDLLLNRWLLYQTLACRVRARSAFYQASGAYGFRDQLQDVMALAVARPGRAREQVLKAASRQFAEGDVQHWWHEPAGRGVRTRISDDLLWLPYVAQHYVAVTGDAALLDESVPFLDGPPLAAGQHESYFEPRVSGERASLFEHGARAIDRSLAVGAHGLPLMGTGDWNDGMNRVGAGGRGESVWLAWFLHAVLVSWAPLAEARGETRRAAAWRAHAAALGEAAERTAWDGAWYRRAYFDDGTPLGTAGAEACALDSIAQSWSVLSGAADPARARRAMASVDERLVRRREGLVLLLDPPFDVTPLEPGYIKGYVPGVRENGGQYTHAAAWVVAAFAALGDGDKAGELLALLNPIRHASTPGGVERYRVEPYVVAGDVYSTPPHVGRGGWTWYTGAAGWLYRAGLESVLGFRLRGARLELDPCIPGSWREFSLAFHHHDTRYDIEVQNPSGVCRGVAMLELDGVALADRSGLLLVDDGRAHRVRVVLGAPAPTIGQQCA